MKTARGDHENGDQFFTTGVTDLMTSVAIIFVLLFVVALQPGPVASVSADPTDSNARDILMSQFERLGLPIEKDPDDPQLLLLIMPESLLNFDFGRATLRPAAEDYLQKVIPQYASAFCGPFRSLIESVTIEGHTDDVGEDRRNLRLSQERAFRVMVKAMDILQGRPEDALPILLKGLNAFRATGAELRIPSYLCLLGDVYTQSARFEDAHNALNEIGRPITTMWTNSPRIKSWSL